MKREEWKGDEDAKDELTERHNRVERKKEERKKERKKEREMTKTKLVKRGRDKKGEKIQMIGKEKLRESGNWVEGEIKEKEEKKEKKERKKERKKESEKLRKRWRK